MTDEHIDLVTVRVQKVPVGCCGVLRQGWEGTIKYSISPPPDLEPKSDILVLDDDTLVWADEVQVIERNSQ